MPSSSQSACGQPEPLPRPQRPFCVLLVDRDPQLGRLIGQTFSPSRCKVHHVKTMSDARRQLSDAPVDLALIESDLPDGSGSALADELRRQHHTTQTIMVCGDPSVQGAINAMRAGAVDFIVKPVGAAELNERVAQAMRRHAAGCRRRKRVRRLKRTCRKLNRMRNEVTQQVDILCKDLVTAYHDLAQQMQQMVQGAEYAALLRRELDLEQLLRKTLEFFLSKAGPTNAAIFLPANGGQFTLGGYVNYECASDSADTVLENLGDVLAPQILQYERPVHITDNDELAAWFAEDAPLLLDNHVVTFTCCHEDETLAVVVLFRHASAPYDESIFEMASGVAPMLGEYLAKVIRIHHRHIDGPDGDWDVGV